MSASPSDTHAGGLVTRPRGRNQMTAVRTDTHENGVNTRPSDETAVRRLYEQMLAGWNQGSGEAFAAPFTEDVDFIAFDGTRLERREEIASVHQDLFDKWLKGTRLTGEVSVRFLVPDVALLVGHGGTVMRGRTEPARERDSIQTLLAVRTGGEWRLTSFHNTRVRPIGERARGALLWLLTDKLWKLAFRRSK